MTLRHPFRTVLIIAFLFFGQRILGLSATPVFAQTPSEVEQLDFASGLFERGFYDMALGEYQKYLQLFPQGQYADEANFGVAESLFFKDDFTAAVDAYQKHLQVFPAGKHLTETYLRLGQANVQLEKYEEALTMLRKIKPEDLDPALRQALYFFSGRALEAQRLDQEAVKAYTAAAQVPEQKKYTAHAFLHLGDIATNNQSFQEALKYYQQALQAAPGEDLKALGFYKQGEALFKAGDLKASAGMFQIVVKDYPQSPLRNDALLNMLVALYESKQYEQVISSVKTYEEKVVNEPVRFQVYNLLLDAYSQLKNFDQALNVAGSIIDGDGYDDGQKQATRLKKMELLVTAGRFQDSLDFIQKVMKEVDTDRDHMLFWQAESLYGLKRYEEAAASYQEILADFPASFYADEASFALAHTQNAQEQFEEALKIFLAYVSSGQDAEKRNQALFNAVQIERRLGATKDAIGHAQEYLASGKESPHYETVLYQLAVLYNENGEFELSGKTFEQYLSEFPDSPRRDEANFFLGLNQQSLGHPQEALTYYDRLATPSPENSFYLAALKNKVIIYLDQKAYPQVADIYRWFMMNVKKPDLKPNAYFWLAQRDMGAGNFTEALEVLGKMDVISDLSDQDQSGRDYYKGEAYRQLNDCANALKQYESVVKKGVTDIYAAPAYLGKGLCLMETKKLDQARTALKAAIEANPDNHRMTMQARFALGQLEEDAKNTDEAIKYYMLVAVLYKDAEFSPQALWKAGQLMEASGKANEAVNAYRSIILQYPQSPFRPQADERIRVLNAG